VIEGHPATAASDIYGLGCTLYYAVTRKVPFPGGSSVQKCHRHLSEQPMDPRRFRQDISDDFLSILNDMLAKDPQKRLQTATEVIERLAPWGGSNLSGAMQKMETPLSASGLRLDTDQSLQDTDQPSGGSQMTTPLPPPRKGRRPQKTGRLFKAITEGIGGMSEIQFYALVGGLSLLIVVLLILLFSF
jgi:serine/threonine protein kinase